VLERLSWLMATRGVPDHVRSDNGSEFTAKAVRAWLGKVGVKTLYIEPGSPWENGYVESLNGKLRDELLNGEIFYTVAEARVLIERWREHYNQVRPHSALGYRPPAPGAPAAISGSDDYCVNCGLNSGVRSIQACVGQNFAEQLRFKRESDGREVRLPCHSLESILAELGDVPVKVLHIDCQGAELPFLRSAEKAARASLLRFVVVSTHHHSISGSPTTHQDCLNLLRHLGAKVLCEHSVQESFSGDGLIVASFAPKDEGLRLPELSRNTDGDCIFT
jgi:hypothetical protein